MRKLTLLLLTALIAPAWAFACALSGPQNDMQRGPRNSEAYLTREVRHVLLGVPWYSVFDIIQYRISGNDVTLMGAVTNPTVKTDAENAVKQIEGVEHVDNQIAVLPPSPMDDQIRIAEYRAIYSQGTLSRYGVGALQSIHIIVKGGHVTLEGTVDTEADKNAAGIYAKGVSNVFSVANNLQVTGSR